MYLGKERLPVMTSCAPRVARLWAWIPCATLCSGVVVTTVCTVRGVAWVLWRACQTAASFFATSASFSTCTCRRRSLSSCCTSLLRQLRPALYAGKLYFEASGWPIELLLLHPIPSTSTKKASFSNKKKNQHFIHSNTRFHEQLK
jgi:hypothetical protein